MKIELSRWLYYHGLSTSIPNAMKTDKLKETLKTNVYATIQQKTQQAADFWKSNFSKEAINKTIEAVKNSAIITKAKNTLDPANIKAAAAKTYENVVKTPIAKTQAALKAKKEQLLDMPLPNFGLSPIPLGPTTNMTVREGIEAAKDTVMQVVGKQDGGGERNKGTGNSTSGIKHNFEYVDSFADHMINAQKIVRRGNKGVVGGHSLESFEKILKDQGWKLDDVIVSRTPHPTAEGVYEIEYRLPTLDRELKIVPGQYKNIPQPKTVYDTNVLSNDQMIVWGKEAMGNGVVNGRLVTGYSSNGLRFTGYLDEHGKIKNFHPSFEGK
ncbi:CdiA family toxin C-terminal domain-containing protein [Lysinibacillus sp. 3P01SB]|uniref:CdiA family toxin C-terminal domain-containing protein n=1 Tax=Lysinibacillus sp. 3P01SB TaxID=3132284 RepID=UPI0039A67EC9